MRSLIFALLIVAFLSGCDDAAVEPGPQLIFKFHFDPDQVRLNNIGEPATLPEGHAAQTPTFRSISAHYIELAPGRLTLLGDGEIVYQGPETNQGGSSAVDFSKAIISGDGEVFLSVPLSQITPGTYEWVRVSLTYQNFDILLDAKINNAELTDVPATAASFVGFNTYITSYKVKDETVQVNANKLQGYVGIETPYTDPIEFQAPQGATTVPNPLFDTSPVPAGSCVVTGEFPEDLVITGSETGNVTVTLSVSINQSFEWEDDNDNGRYEPLLDEKVVDMGLRGLVPTATYN